MLIEVSESFAKSLLEEEHPQIIFQNIIWDVININKTSNKNHWKEWIYELEIKVAK